MRVNPLSVTATAFAGTAVLAYYKSSEKTLSIIKACGETALSHLIQNNTAKLYFGLGAVIGLTTFLLCSKRTAAVANKEFTSTIKMPSNSTALSHQFASASIPPPSSFTRPSPSIDANLSVNPAGSLKSLRAIYSPRAGKPVAGRMPMSTIPKQDLLRFCQKMTNVEAMEEILSSNTGLKGKDNLIAANEAFKNGNYAAVLAAIWSEGDNDAVLEWISEKWRRGQLPLPGPILYELALAIFIKDKQVESLIENTIPLLFAACFREKQDACCFADNELQEIPELRLGIYVKMLLATIEADDLIPLDIKKKFTTAVTNKFKNWKDDPEIHEILRKVACETLKQDLPSPEWIGYSLKQYGKSDPKVVKVSLASQETMRMRRNEYANKIIALYTTK